MPGIVRRGLPPDEYLPSKEEERDRQLWNLEVQDFYTLKEEVCPLPSLVLS